MRSYGRDRTVSVKKRSGSRKGNGGKQLFHDTDRVTMPGNLPHHERRTVDLVQLTSDMRLGNATVVHDHAVGIVESGDSGELVDVPDSPPVFRREPGTSHYA
jgi:hypothetical protein